MTPTDGDVPVDPAQDVPDVTATDESAGDKTARYADENAGTPGTIYTVQAGQKIERNGVLLEAGATVEFTSLEVAAGVVTDLLGRGTIA